MDQILKVLAVPEFGNALTLIDILVTIVGFIIAIGEAFRARSASKKAQAASERAELAVAKIQEDIRRVNTISDLASAITTMEEIKRLHRAGDTKNLLDRYGDVKKMLISTRDGNPDLSETHREKISTAVVQLRKMEERLESQLAKEPSVQSLAKFNNVLSPQIDAVYGVLIEVQSTIGR